MYVRKDDGAFCDRWRGESAGQHGVLQQEHRSQSKTTGGGVGVVKSSVTQLNDVNNHHSQGAGQLGGADRKTS